MGFLAGVFVGAFIGFILTGLMVASGDKSRCEECSYRKKVEDIKHGIH